MTIDNSLCQQSVPKNSSWAQVNWMDHQFSGSSPSLSSPKYLGRKKKSKESATSAASSRHIITTITRAMDRPVAGPRRDPPAARPRELLSTLSNKWCSALETALPRTARHWPYVIGLWPYCHAANFSYDIWSLDYDYCLPLCDSDCTRTRTGQLQIGIIFREKNVKTDKHCAFRKIDCLKIWLAYRILHLGKLNLSAFSTRRLEDLESSPLNHH